MADASLNYWWFAPEVAHELARRIKKAGPRLARLRAVPNFSVEPATLTFFLDDKDDGGVTIQSHDGVNDSHACPPQCS